ncbi:VOC family protein [Prolixibacter denitrificans]|uniref:Catechol 2,3-dioxygenase-like lactoylglutathione lyase family enzyme n=1 Tax=Prolixibacter denitrificans TaxID=1541063 RepID=A0A2P8C6Y2_9BACT|nr:VOC family protein [Prolixibacter denitrificans]PSK80729.1 catechol 2,3-dioxygenase-like lactoylglutathione lyase family enzyme [Prolixibacter denitrificans]GET22472.1 virulence protein [Prolixibacter denitrificans]
MKIDRIDHIVLTVANMAATIEFYTEILGMELVVFGNNRKALSFGRQKINLHPKGNEFEPKASAPTCGSADICLVSATAIEEVQAELIGKGVKIIEGIVERTGATGKIRSLYLRDPDGNLIEISDYA